MNGTVEKFNNEVRSIERSADPEFQKTQREIEADLSWEEKELAYQKRIDELETLLSKFGAEVDSLNNQISGAKTELESVTNKLEELEKLFKDLQREKVP
jgi:uncharacterized coiled-coil protein SlyX